MDFPTFLTQGRARDQFEYWRSPVEDGRATNLMAVCDGLNGRFGSIEEMAASKMASLLRELAQGAYDSGRVELAQRRNEDGSLSYLAIMRERPTTRSREQMLSVKAHDLSTQKRFAA